MFKEQLFCQCGMMGRFSGHISILLLLLGTSLSLSSSLNPDETSQLVSAARNDPTNAAQYYEMAISGGTGPSVATALYEFSQLHSHTPETDFSLLLRLVHEVAWL